MSTPRVMVYATWTLGKQSAMVLLCLFSACSLRLERKYQLVKMMEKQRRSVGILVDIRRGLCGLEKGRFADLALNVTGLFVLFGHVSKRCQKL